MAWRFSTYNIWGKIFNKPKKMMRINFLWFSYNNLKIHLNGELHGPKLSGHKCLGFGGYGALRMEEKVKERYTLLALKRQGHQPWTAKLSALGRLEGKALELALHGVYIYFSLFRIFFKLFPNLCCFRLILDYYK